MSKIHRALRRAEFERGRLAHAPRGSAGTHENRRAPGKRVPEKPARCPGPGDIGEAKREFELNLLAERLQRRLVHVLLRLESETQVIFLDVTEQLKRCLDTIVETTFVPLETEIRQAKQRLEAVAHGRVLPDTRAATHPASPPLSSTASDTPTHPASGGGPSAESRAPVAGVSGCSPRIRPAVSVLQQVQPKQVEP